MLNSPYITAHQVVAAQTVNQKGGGVATCDEREFAHRMADANDQFRAAQQTVTRACANLGGLLTEQIARHLSNVAPAAATLHVRPVAEYHRAPEACPRGACPGHQRRLAPAGLYDADGAPLPALDNFDPVVWWVERLTIAIGLTEAFLALGDREWTCGTPQGEASHSDPVPQS